jgi:GPI ethanolamine phosphate transferase 1
VLDQLRILFKNATADATLNSQLRSDKVIFFLHLLGLDTTGHSYRPHSKVIPQLMSSEINSKRTALAQEYMNNIWVVDSIVRQTETLMSEFYEDDETSYIFTADHGMSVIGNHGDGGELCLPTV